jgi:electron transport complex protein RnfD
MGKNTAATNERMEFLVSSSPHMHSGESIPKIMWWVSLALAPATIMAIVLFQWKAIVVLTSTIGSAVIFEALIQKWRGVPIRIKDGSGFLAGLLLALNLPPSSPAWMCVVGSFIMIVIAKELYGGLGYNPFNPALVARVALLIAFPTQMTSWTSPSTIPDSVTGATPLALAKENLLLQGAVNINFDLDLAWDLLVGNIMGSLGETSVIALVSGGVLLLLKGYINWRVPFSFISTVFVITGVVWFIDPSIVANPFYHVWSGGLMLGAIFMATDMVTSPVTLKGMWIFGIGCGLITAVIRLWGGYPEGVAFAILIMNATVPLIDRYTKPRVFGQKRKIYEVAQ